MENFKKISDSKGLRFDIVDYRMQRGIAPVVCIDLARLSIDGPNAVWMQAYATKEAVDATLASGLATFWSRSKQGLWTKGLISGNIMPVRAIYADYDMDGLLYDVNPVDSSSNCTNRIFEVSG